MNSQDKTEKIVNLCKRRGFVYPGSEIYGGLANSFDFGPLGVELKNNLKQLWWKKFVQEREDVLGLESTIIMHPKIWQASGHLKNFIDPLVECKSCHQRYRADLVKEKCPNCGKKDFTPKKDFNTMFKTFLGPVENEAAIVYLRPETAQGIFVDLPLLLETMRLKLPFGIAQIGKSFRNEITTGNFLFRIREFEIAELEYFVRSGQDEKAFEEWLKFMEKVLIEDFGLTKKNLRRYEHPKKNLAHYSKRTVDIQYRYPWGWDELWGLANRTDYDLREHEKFSGHDLKYRDPETGEKFWPYVVEPTGGIERLFLAVLNEAYTEVKGGRTTTTQSTKEVEVVLRFKKYLAPIKIAILPLVRKESLVKLAQKIYYNLKKDWLVQYDELGSIGRRYRRQDEVGTPYCLTVDFESLEDKKVTVRDRDTMKQERVRIEELSGYLRDKLK